MSSIKNLEKSQNFSAAKVLEPKTAVPILEEGSNISQQQLRQPLSLQELTAETMLKERMISTSNFNLGEIIEKSNYEVNSPSAN